MGPGPLALGKLVAFRLKLGKKYVGKQDPEHGYTWLSGCCKLFFEMYNKFPASFTDRVFAVFLQWPYKKEWPNGTV